MALGQENIGALNFFEDQSDPSRTFDVFQTRVADVSDANLFNLQSQISSSKPTVPTYGGTITTPEEDRFSTTVPTPTVGSVQTSVPFSGTGEEESGMPSNLIDRPVVSASGNVTSPTGIGTPPSNFSFTPSKLTYTPDATKGMAGPDFSSTASEVDPKNYLYTSGAGINVGGKGADPTAKENKITYDAGPVITKPNKNLGKIFTPTELSDAADKNKKEQQTKAGQLTGKGYVGGKGFKAGGLAKIKIKPTAKKRKGGLASKK